MKSRDSNTDHEDQLIHWVVDKIFVLPAGHEEVSNLLKEEFLKKYKAQLEKIDATDPANLVEQLTNLLNIFLPGTWQDNDIISGIRQIYEKAIETEVANILMIGSTSQGLISRSDANKRAYANQTSTTPVKSFVAIEYNKLNSSPSPAKYIEILKKKLPEIHEARHFEAASILNYELELIRKTLLQKDELIAELNNFEHDVANKQAFDSRFDTIISSLGKKPFFVINTPMFVPIDETTLTDSSDEELDGEYSLDDFKVPPYYVKFGNDPKIKSGPKSLAERGKLLKYNLQRVQLSNSSNPSSYADPFLEKLKFEGWTEEFTGNAFAVIGLNSSRSLSTARNQALYDEFNRVTKSDLPHEVMGFFWDRTWYKKEDNAETKVSYAEARKFYKQFKKFNRNEAKDFRKRNENNGDVPYQDIRERLKESAEAAEIVGRIREKSPDTTVYLSLTDSDTKHFNGIYTEYENFVIGQSSSPHVMSTGYEFSDDPKDYDDPSEDLISKLANLNLASKIDRAVRIETAKLIPTGVYYPEPNTSILIPSPHIILPATFLDYSPSSQGKDESAVVLREIIKKRDTSFHFIDGRPLITALPKRAFKRARAGMFKFSEALTRDGFYTEDVQKREVNLTNLADLAQSHFHSLYWAKYLYKNNPDVLKDNNEKYSILSDLFSYMKAKYLLDNASHSRADGATVTDETAKEGLLKYYEFSEANKYYMAAESSMKRVRDILGNRYLQHPAYQPFAKGKYVSAVSTARRDDMHLAMVDSQMQALGLNDIGPSELEGYVFQDVPRDGNSFYYAVVEQLKKVAPHLLSDTKELPAHEFVRRKVQDKKYQDREQATEEHFRSFVQIFGTALAIIDTRHPAKGFNTRYFDGQRIVHVFPLHLVLLPQNMPVVKIAATGDRFLSVITTPQDHAVTSSPQVDK